MELSLDDIKYTIDFNFRELLNNKYATNEFIVEDLLVYLGYNRRRNREVIKLVDNEYDWDIEGKFKIKVYGYEDNLEPISNNQELVMVTNGKELELYKYGIKLSHIDIFDNSIKTSHVLKCLSKTLFSEEELVNNSLTIKNIKESIEENADMLVDSILDTLNKEKTDSSKAFVKNLLLRGNIEETLETSRIDIDKIKQKDVTIRTLEEKVKVLENSDRYLKLASQIRNLTEDKVELQKHIDNLEREIERLNSDKDRKEKSLENSVEKVLEEINEEDSNEITYIGVIGSNENTIQVKSTSLSKFAGECIEELQKIVGFKLLPVIFDGDILKLARTPVRNDFRIATKMYDIDSSELNYDNIELKLSIMFSKFENIVFKMKVLNKGNIYKELAVLDLNNIIQFIIQECFDTETIQYVEYKKKGMPLQIGSSLPKDEYFAFVLKSIIDNMILQAPREINVEKLNKMDLTDISGFIVKDKKGKYKIGKTNYSLDNVINFNAYGIILKGISEILEIDSKEYKLYLQGKVLTDKGNQYIKKIRFEV